MYIRRILFILHCVVEVETTPFQSDSVPRLISFNAERFEYNESSFYELNCSSSRQSMGNGAEFIINGKTVEHIAFHKNKCYDSKQKECTLDHCQCGPRDNVYIHKHKYRNKHTERIIGCQMRFANNETGDVIKAVLSIWINETTIETLAYHVKVLQKHKEKNREDENKASFAEKITEWMPLLFCLLLVNIVCFIVVLWCHARSMTRRDSLPLPEMYPYEDIPVENVESCSCSCLGDLFSRRQKEPVKIGFTGKKYDVKTSYVIEDPHHIPDAICKTDLDRKTEAKQACKNVPEETKKVAAEKLTEYVHARKPLMSTSDVKE